MTFSTSAIWEVRPTNGSSNNGGGFAPGEGATTQSGTVLTIDASNNLKVTDSGYTFLSTDAGKWLKINWKANATPSVISGQVTTLSAAITSTGQTSISVTSGANIANGDYLGIGIEWMLVTSGGGTTTLTITRAQLGTSAATALNGAIVVNYKYQWSTKNYFSASSDYGWYQITSVTGGAATLQRSPTFAGNPGTATWTMYSGIDYSQQNSAQVAIDNATIICTTPGASSNTLTFVSGYTPTAADIGNVVQILAGGTNINAGFYVISAFTSTTWTLAGFNNLTTAGGAGALITGNMGGALKNITDPFLVNGTLASIFVKAEGSAPHITITASQTINSGNTAPSDPACSIIGYSTTRGDNGQVTIQSSTNTGITTFIVSDAGTFIYNFIIDCNSLGASIGINFSTFSSIWGGVFNCEVKNFASRGIWSSSPGAQTFIYGCNVHGGTSAATAAIETANISAGPSVVAGNYVHDNACIGILVLSTGAATVCYNIVDNNSGASSDGIQIQFVPGTAVFNNTINRSGRHGIYVDSSDSYTLSILRNLICNSGNSTGTNAAPAFGIHEIAAIATPIKDGNAFYNNLSANRDYGDEQGFSFSNFGAAPYVNIYDVFLTANPFNNVAGQDYGLNNVAGGGASVKGITGKSWLGTSTVNAVTFGAVGSSSSSQVVIGYGAG